MRSWFIKTKSDIQAQQTFECKNRKRKQRGPLFDHDMKSLSRQVVCLKEASRLQTSEETELVPAAYTTSQRNICRALMPKSNGRSRRWLSSIFFQVVSFSLFYSNVFSFAIKQT